MSLIRFVEISWPNQHLGDGASGEARARQGTQLNQNAACAKRAQSGCPADAKEAERNEPDRDLSNYSSPQQLQLEKRALQFLL